MALIVALTAAVDGNYYNLTYALTAAAAAPAAAEGGVQLKWKGFVNPHYYADSRAVVGGREDMMLFYPKPVVLDADGTDLNAGWQGNMLAITTRLGLDIKGPDALGAKTAAYIEGDFTGATNATINNLRLRHAYLTLDWGAHRLLAGQYWHPMVVHEIMPMTNPLNMGAPFHPYARYNQVRYDGRAGGLHWVAVASWQLDNMSQGIGGTSTYYQRNSMLPELTAQLRYQTGSLRIGAAINLKTLHLAVAGNNTIASPLHTSVGYSLFGMYTIGRLTLKAQTLINNSMYEICSLGGYYINSVGEVKDWKFNTVWLDAEWKLGRWRPGIFMGYAHNFRRWEIGSTLFGRGMDINDLWRVQPRLTYQAAQQLEFTAEAEYTSATYLGSDPVGNLRLSLSAVYSF